MKGKTIVATGATSGIGESAVLELARLGGRIVIVARDEARAQATMRKLEAKAPTAGHRVHLADLSSMAETRKVGAAIAVSEPRIDVLINNAGALFSERRVTPEGLRTDLRPQPHGLFRVDPSAARKAHRLVTGANRLHLLDRAPRHEPRLR
jgi:NAD(P)-dependent dehydrogenase (short-subunit alcohol dehydrogenase family)